MAGTETQARLSTIPNTFLTFAGLRKSFSLKPSDRDPVENLPPKVLTPSTSALAPPHAIELRRPRRTVEPGPIRGITLVLGGRTVALHVKLALLRALDDKYGFFGVKLTLATLGESACRRLRRSR